MIIAIYGAAAEGVIKFDVYNIPFNILYEQYFFWLLKFIFLLVLARLNCLSFLFLIRNKTFIAYGMFDSISRIRKTFKSLSD